MKLMLLAQVQEGLIANFRFPHSLFQISYLINWISHNSAEISTQAIPRCMKTRGMAKNEDQPLAHVWICVAWVWSTINGHFNAKTDLIGIQTRDGGKTLTEACESWNQKDLQIW